MKSVVLLAWILVSLFLVDVCSAGVKPVTGMPDYNGTYYGSPNTGGDCDSLSANCDSAAGRKMFTTLYRDNYTRSSGCAGEGCGKHPGVDIAVASNTPVRAVLGGTVVSSMCDWNRTRGFSNGATGFGGLIIVESTSSYASTNKVYTAYAHLNKWDIVSQGQTVSEGQVIGYSGGDPWSGTCPGASDGAHFHFQVDKSYPTNGKPWFPTGRVEEADINLEVLQYTHNPLPFVLGYAYNYTFTENNNREWWGAGNGNSYGVTGGDLWFDSSSSNPYLGRSNIFGHVVGCGETAPCSREITLDANIFKKLVISLNFKCYNSNLANLEFLHWAMTTFLKSQNRKYSIRLWEDTQT